MHHSVSYIVRSFHLNRFILLRVMQENKSVFLKHSLVYVGLLADISIISNETKSPFSQTKRTLTK